MNIKRPAFLDPTLAKDQTQLILSKLDFNYRQMYQIGQTKVFLKEILDNYLEQQCNLIRHKSAIMIQKNFKMRVQRKKYLSIRNNIILIQKFIKFWLER